jgi:hypothetical protein
MCFEQQAKKDIKDVLMKVIIRRIMKKCIIDYFNLERSL